MDVAGMDTVLIVDDSSFIVEGLIAFLKKKYIPLAAYGGGECLEILKREIPSVIILDIMMEPMDGWETLSRIKEDPRTRHIPVLMFSAMKISAAEAEVHRISIDDCLTKPVSPNKIIEAIEKVLARRDTTLMVVERWQSAGISQEKIDEYLSLAASLEVDLSLCQNMKIQYDLEHQNDKNLEEFDVVISAIGDRILQERDQIETLVREMNEIIAREAGRSEPEGAKVPPVAEGSGNPPGDPALPGDKIPSPPTGEAPPETPVAGVAATIPETPYDSVPDPVSTAAPGDSPSSPPAPGYQDDNTLKTNSGPDIQVSDPYPEEPGTPAPASSDTATAGIPAPLTDPFIAEAGKNGPVSPTMNPVDDDRTGVMPGHPAPHPVRDSTRPDTRNVIPADPDKRPDSPKTSSVTGAGTDVPMPWSSLPDRNPGSIIDRLNGKVRNPDQDPVSQRPGIMARILSFVRSLLGK